MYIHIYIYNALAELIHHELVRQASVVAKGFRGALLCCATLCVDLFSLVSLGLVRLQGRFLPIWMTGELSQTTRPFSNFRALVYSPYKADTELRLTLVLFCLTWSILPT